ncbi:hypothetical protein Ahy_B01g056334 [Arachis hypogaea]|uniref:DUF4283 domain-containing protein n=1 Tax=Arachis hypogaea TaxID=3818 RepID=A0A445AYP6_ARAHY|nr:hypothetical protein Ahy_B01g056334 [Arachis hypogaea]
MGLPVHLWSKKTFWNFGRLWYDYVMMDDLTESNSSYCASRILIDSCQWEPIQEWVMVKDGDMDFEVFVKEFGREIYSVQVQPGSTICDGEFGVECSPGTCKILGSKEVTEVASMELTVQESNLLEEEGELYEVWDPLIIDLMQRRLDGAHTNVGYSAWWGHDHIFEEDSNGYSNKRLKYVRKARDVNSNLELMMVQYMHLSGGRPIISNPGEEFINSFEEAVATKHICKETGMVFDGVDDDVLLASLMDKGQRKCRRMYGLRKRGGKGTTSLVAPRQAGDRWLAVLGCVNEIKMMGLICVVYGAHDKAEKLKLWPKLSDLRTTCRALMVIGGDFNDILKPEKRLGCKVLSQSGCEFKAWVENMELVVLELSGRKYTWYGGRRCSRIDRGLPRSLSDHCGLLVDSGKVDWGPKSFRSLDAWLSHGGFVSVVKGEWCSMNGSDALRKLLRQWNKECFGSIESNLVKLEEKMKNVDEEIEKGGNDECLLARAMTIRNVIEVWYKRREDYWKQLSRSRFASQMDKNTKFFHSVAKTRRRSKVMKEIHINGNCYRGVGRVKNEVQRFYKEEQKLNILFDKSLVKSISATEARGMELIPSKEEIRSAVWGCVPSRAVGPDGFNFKFIRRLWEVIGDDFCSLVRKSFVDRSLPKEANLTWVTLAHKEGGTNELKDYWPISMVGCLYKVCFLRNSLFVMFICSVGGPRLLSAFEFKFHKDAGTVKPASCMRGLHGRRVRGCTNDAKCVTVLLGCLRCTGQRWPMLCAAAADIAGSAEPVRREETGRKKCI